MKPDSPSCSSPIQSNSFWASIIGTKNSKPSMKKESLYFPYSVQQMYVRISICFLAHLEKRSRPCSYYDFDRYCRSTWTTQLHTSRHFCWKLKGNSAPVGLNPSIEVKPMAEKNGYKEQEGPVRRLIFAIREFTRCTGKCGVSFPGRFVGNTPRFWPLDSLASMGFGGQHHKLSAKGHFW